MHNSRGHMHSRVHCSTIYHNQDVEATLMSINGGVHKEDLVHIYSGIVLHYKTE